MGKHLSKRIKKIGAPPGSLIYLGEYPLSKVRLSVIEYGPDFFEEKLDATLEECLEKINTPTNSWITVRGVQDPKTIEAIGKSFKLHPLMLEDIVSASQRAKVDDYKENIFIVMRILHYDEEKNDIMDEQVSFVMGSNYLITFLENSHDSFEPVRDRLRKEKAKIRQLGVDYLCYTLIDDIVDRYYLILERMDEQIGKLEAELVSHPTNLTLLKIQHLKRQILTIKRAIWPTREVVSQLRRAENPLIQDSTKIYLYDVYDHSIQVVETIESFRDIVTGMLDVYLSNINLRMNEIMKVLTIVSTIFVPLTFIASIYGMNFEHMPELHYTYSYPMVLCIMLISALGMLYFFRRKKWI